MATTGLISLGSANISSARWPFHKLIGLVSGALRLQDIARRALEIQFPMAKIMHTPRAQRMRSGSTPRFQDVAGRVAYDEMFDLSRLTRTSET